jgi:MFS family permease
VAALAVGGIQVVMTLVCTQLMDRAGRRPLLLTSTVGMAFCTAVLSVYFNYKAALAPALRTAVSLGALVGDIVFFSLGLGAIPWLLVSEVRVESTLALLPSGVPCVRASCSHPHRRSPFLPSTSRLRHRGEKASRAFRFTVAVGSTLGVAPSCSQAP